MDLRKCIGGVVQETHNRRFCESIRGRNGSLFLFPTPVTYTEGTLVSTERYLHTCPRIRDRRHSSRRSFRVNE